MCYRYRYDAIATLLYWDLYAMEGLRGVYIASTVAEGVAESEVRPTYLTVLITFDGVAE